jgi:preprotein translocase subunit YajC
VLQDLLHGLVAQTAEGGGSGFVQWIPFVFIFVVMYFLIIRPQQQQQKKQQQLVNQLKKGDDVLLQSGIYGKVYEVRADDMLVELAPNVRVRVLKSAVTAQPASTQSTGSDTKSEAEKKS